MAPETTHEGAVGLAERIRSMVEAARFAYQDQLIEVTVSIGFAVAAAGSNADYDQMKHLAAQALSEAKASGRNRSIVRELASASAERDGAGPADHLDGPPSDWVV